MYKTLCTIGLQSPNEILIELPKQRIDELLELGLIVKVVNPKTEIETEILAESVTKIKKA
jgi:hypothetical protein